MPKNVQKMPKNDIKSQKMHKKAKKPKNAKKCDKKTTRPSAVLGR